MDASTLVLMAASYAASMVANEAGRKVFDAAYDRVSAFAKNVFKRDPRTEASGESQVDLVVPDVDELAVTEAREVLGLSPVLGRAQMVESVLRGARLLWVDDNPDNNIYERIMLASLGVIIDLSLSTNEALVMLARQPYDAIISDIERQGVMDEGLRFLQAVQGCDVHPPTIFYTFRLDPRKPIPPGAFAITQRPDDLLHYILDILERVRV